MRRSRSRFPGWRIAKKIWKLFENQLVTICPTSYKKMPACCYLQEQKLSISKSESFMVFFFFSHARLLPISIIMFIMWLFELETCLIIIKGSSTRKSSIYTEDKPCPVPSMSVDNSTTLKTLPWRIPACPPFLQTHGKLTVVRYSCLPSHFIGNLI